LRGPLQTQHLSGTATRLANELASASILAIKENKTLEVHFLAEDSEFKGTPRIRACQIYAINPAIGKCEPFGERWLLDDGVVVLDDPVFSSLLSHKTPSDFEGGYALRPNGSTDLGKANTEHWCITLVSECNLPLKGGVLPPDYRTLLISAHTAAVVVY
jgi:uncharacterized protein (TIGR02596 family)